MKSVGDVKAKITGSAGLWLTRAGAQGSGTILKLTLPITLRAAERDASASHSLDGVCLQFCPHLTALKLTAKSVYGKYNCHWFFRWPYFKCRWSGWQDYKTFFEYDGFEKELGQYSQCVH